MNWSIFIQWVLGFYLIYYMLIIVIDLLKNNKSEMPIQAVTSYNIQELFDTEKEETMNVNDSFDNETGLEPKVDRDQTKGNNKQFEFSTSIDGQGIPVEEFLKNAKSLTGNIHF
ncbi:hypothetical protein [Chondrinema litorale]|uniref:hypothetical protein n=1 Tax=Chondrinema litorale TaxID=2994555 RepID=UPI0025434A2A|nr:hypothetical protein [Chondrinema litorale]UZR99622.1 hypothetical protein OQ292_37165 [Chondrinema litorale]